MYKEDEYNDLPHMKRSSNISDSQT